MFDIVPRPGPLPPSKRCCITAGCSISRLVHDQQPSRRWSPHDTHMRAALACDGHACHTSCCWLQMLEARSGQHKQLRGLLAYLAASHVSAIEAAAIESRVLHHLDWRLGPYFAPAELAAW
jgi:hypothetical protein